MIEITKNLTYIKNYFECLNRITLSTFDIQNLQENRNDKLNSIHEARPIR